MFQNSPLWGPLGKKIFLYPEVPTRGIENFFDFLKRVAGIEPAPLAWKAISYSR